MGAKNDPTSSLAGFGMSACSCPSSAWWRPANKRARIDTLTCHTSGVTSDNDVAHYNLGCFFFQRGDLDGAISRFETALQIRSRNSAAHYNFGSALIENNLANLLAQKGRLNAAVDHYHNAMRLRP